MSFQISLQNKPAGSSVSIQNEKFKLKWDVSDENFFCFFCVSNYGGHFDEDINIVVEKGLLRLNTELEIVPNFVFKENGISSASLLKVNYIGNRKFNKI